MKDETKLAVLGRDPEGHNGAVNIPVYRASTILQPSLKALSDTYSDRAQDKQVTTYGRVGTPLTYAFENTVAELEGGYRAMAYPSGLAACSGAILSLVKSGDHILVIDNIYGPTRQFCDTVLKRLGVETEYFKTGIDPASCARSCALIPRWSSLSRRVRSPSRCWMCRRLPMWCTSMAPNL